MELGFVGLGRMGYNMVLRLVRGGHRVVAYNRTAEKTKEVMGQGAEGSFSLEDLVGKLKAPRTVWLMLPAGPVTGEYIEDLMKLLSPGDTIVDGGNSMWKDTIARAKMVTGAGFHYVDCGTSGGIWGLRNGYCLMVGGEKPEFDRLEPIFATLAQERGYGYMGESGAGHFVKMVHNGIEYGMMQAYGEGFEIMKASQYGPDLDFAKISDLWNHGSVVKSWLLELAAIAFTEDPQLEKIRGYVEDSGEGRWTVQAAIDENVPAPVITLSLQMRFRSRQQDTFSGKVLAALRNQFGGHAVQFADGTESGTSGV